MNNLVQYPEYPKSLTKVLESQPQWDNGAIYSKECIFKIENYGSVKMFFLNFTPRTNVLTSFPVPSSPYIIENVFLECNGVAFCRADTTYTLGRIDDLKGSGLYDQILTASTIQGTFDNTYTGTISLPLFFFVIDQQMLNVDSIKNLTIRVRTKSSRQGFGMDNNLTSLGITLTTLYSQSITKDGIMIPSPPLKNYYNIMTDIQSVPVASNTDTIKLNCPSKIKNLYFMIRSTVDEGTLLKIVSIKLRFTNGQESLFNNLNNFTLSDKDGKNDGSTFRIEMEDYLKVNGNMKPVIATLVHNSSLSLSNLYVVYEYESVLEEKDGMIMETYKESIY